MKKRLLFVLIMVLCILGFDIPVFSSEVMQDRGKNEYPTQAFGDKTVDGISVSASVDEGVFPSGTEIRTFSVTPEVEEQIKQVVSSLIGEDQVVVDLVSAEICFLKNGEQIQPENGKNVHLEIYSDNNIKGENYLVVHFENYQKAEIISPAEAASTWAAFDVSSFSIKKEASDINLGEESTGSESFESSIISENYSIYSIIGIERIKDEEKEEKEDKKDEEKKEDEEIIEYEDIVVEVLWNDNENSDGIRPSSVIVNLFANGEKIDTASVTETYNWKYSFEDLIKTKSGENIEYTIEEEAVEGYSSSIDGFSIKNKHEIATTMVEGEIMWNDDGNRDGIRPSSFDIELYANNNKIETVTVTEKNNWKYSFKNLPMFDSGLKILYTIRTETVDGYETTIEGFNIINSHSTETTKVEGNVTWNDNGNHDGIRPKSVSVYLLVNGKKTDTVNISGDNEWKYSFESLPKFDSGKKIVYTIEQDTVEGYTTTIDGFNIKNTHEISTINIEGEVMWIDDDNQDGKRPEEVKISLLSDNKTIDTIVLTEKEEWKYSFKNLPMYESGKKIDYVVEEQDVEGYKTEVEGFYIKNIHDSEEITIEVKMIWNDEENIDGKRPRVVNITLLADSEKIDEKPLTESKEWKHSFKYLPKYKNGKEIVYTIEEVTVEGYITQINGFEITSTYEPKPADEPKNDSNSDEPSKAKNNNPFLWITIITLIGVAVAGLVYYKKKK